MKKAVYTYYRLTMDGTPYTIAKSWFEGFRQKNMAACITEHVFQNQKTYNVWVEYDPALFGFNEVSKARRGEALFGKIVESCGGFQERFNFTWKTLKSRTNYEFLPDPSCLEELNALGGAE